MEHCPDIVDSSVFGSWATPRSQMHTLWRWFALFLLVLVITQEFSRPLHVCVCHMYCWSHLVVWVSKLLFRGLFEPHTQQTCLTATANIYKTLAHNSLRLTIILAMFHTVSLCKHATYTQSSSVTRTTWRSVHWRRVMTNTAAEKKTRTELEQCKLQRNLFSYCTLKPNCSNKLQTVLLKDLQHILCLEK